MNKTLPLALAAGLLLLPALALAEHKSAVAGQVVDTASLSQSDNGCPGIHFHGTLNGVADPEPHGCGHGRATLIAHGDGDGESLPAAAPAEKGYWDRFTTWVSSLWTPETKKTIGNVVDVAAEANGVLPPNDVSDLVDITKEMTPQIMEKVEGIKEYRESVPEGEDTLGIYNNLDKTPANPSLSDKFFKWFNSLVK